MATKDNITKLNDQDRSKLLSKTVYSLPDNPSNKGFSAAQIKGKMYEGELLIYDWIKTLETQLHTSFDSYDASISTLNGYFTSGSANMAVKAAGDESGNNIKSSYGATLEGVSEIGGGNQKVKFILKNKNGIELSAPVVTLREVHTSEQGNPDVDFAGLMSPTDKRKLDKLNGAIYIFKGSVATYADLPSNVTENGWVYNVIDTDTNYASVYSNNVLVWDPLGGDLQNYFKKDGSVAMTGDFNGGNNDITNVDNATFNKVATDEIGAKTSGGSVKATSDIDLDSKKLTNVATPTASGDGANKGYVDTALASYRTSSAQDVIDNQIKEIAEGKTKTYIISYTNTAPTTDSEAQSLKKADGTSFVDLADFTSYVDGLDLMNSLFNSQDTILDITYQYLITTDSYVFKDTDIYQKWKKGDNIFVSETNVPDRWYDGENYLYILETTKVDLTNYAKKNEDNNFSSAQTFKSSIKLVDSNNSNLYNIFSDTNGNLYIQKGGSTVYLIGSSKSKSKDLEPLGSSYKIGSSSNPYTYGYFTNIGIGSATETTEHIIGNVTTRTTDSSSTTFSGSLTSNTDYDYGVLTSITISSLETKVGDQSPSWLFKFTVGSGLTFTLPSGYAWEGGTPDFTTMVSEQHIVLFMFGKAYLI